MSAHQFDGNRRGSYRVFAMRCRIPGVCMIKRGCAALRRSGAAPLFALARGPARASRASNRTGSRTTSWLFRRDPGTVRGRLPRIPIVWFAGGRLKSAACRSRRTLGYADLGTWRSLPGLRRLRETRLGRARSAGWCRLLVRAGGGQP
jgi:hypothetical protein